MNQLNSVIVEGNLVKDAEFTERQGYKICNLPIAVNYWYKNKDGQVTSSVSYFDVRSFGQSAEYSAKFGLKGRGIRVVGHLKQERWTDENDKTHSAICIIAEHIEFKSLNKKAEDNPETENTTEEDMKTATVTTEVTEEVF